MFVDLSQAIQDDSLFHADLCIIGGGAAGISIAHDMLDSGLKVVLIESGTLIESDRNQALYAGSSTGRPVEMAVGRYRVFGGSTSRWAGRCATLDPIDLMQRDWVEWSGWPITADDLNAFYGPAASICGLRQAMYMAMPEAEPTAAPEVPHVTGPRCADRFQWQFPEAADQSGLRFGIIYHEELRRASDTTVFLHANIQGVEVDRETLQIKTIRAVSLSGRSVTVSARAYVLCCGGIENARILLNTVIAVPGGLGNRNDLVGRFFMQHPRGDTATVTASRPQARTLQESFNIFPTGTRAREETGFALPASVQREQGLLNASAMISYQGRPGSGWEAARRVAQAVRTREVGRGVLRNGARIIADPADLALNVYRRLKGQRLRSWLLEEGPIADEDLVGNYHHIGTTRMAADPARGVVDVNCQLHGGTNMFIAGCSVFPTGGHANPTLTIVALALRLSAHLKRMLWDGVSETASGKP